MAPNPASDSARRVADRPRIRRARRRAAVAKAAVLLAGAAGFAVAIDLARASHPAHAKGKPRSLSAPGRFVEIVRRNRLEAGIAAPAEAPPDAATSVS
jgi:hypothetical protein